MRAVVNSWMVEERSRLARIQSHEQIARDLADLFIQDLNDQLHLSLTFTCAPDVAQRNRPAPDFVYSDTKASVSIALEVTRLYDERRTECERHWADFSRRVVAALNPEGTGYFYMVIPYCLRVPSTTDAPAKVAQELAALKPGQSADLTSLLGRPARAGRLQQSCQGVIVEPVVMRPTVDLASKYAKDLKEANGKLRHWRSEGYETFLLYDARMLDTLPSHGLRRFRTWHGVAHQYHEEGFGDPRIDGPCPFVYRDFDSLDHVLVLDLGSSGIGVTSTWQRRQCRLCLPDEWCFKPPCWHDD